MATNIEQIFRSFVVNKIREIQDEQLHSVKVEEQTNGEKKPSVEERAPEGIATAFGGIQDDQIVQKIEQVLSETLEGRQQANPNDESMTIIKVVKEEPAGKDCSEAPRKKDKKHKKHKKKKKKKKKAKDERRSRSRSHSSSGSGPDSGSESQAHSRSRSDSPLKSKEDGEAKLSPSRSRKDSCNTNRKLESKESHSCASKSIDCCKEQAESGRQTTEEVGENKLNELVFSDLLEGDALPNRTDHKSVKDGAGGLVSPDDGSSVDQVKAECSAGNKPKSEHQKDETPVKNSSKSSEKSKDKSEKAKAERGGKKSKKSRSRSHSRSKKDRKRSSSHSHLQCSPAKKRKTRSRSRNWPSSGKRKSSSRSASRDRKKCSESSLKSRRKRSISQPTESKPQKHSSHSKSHRRSRSRSVGRKKSDSPQRSRTRSHSRHRRKTRSRSKSRGRCSKSKERYRRSPGHRSGSTDRRHKSVSRERYNRPARLRYRSRSSDRRRRSRSLGRRHSILRSPERRRISKSAGRKQSFTRSPDRKRTRSPGKRRSPSRSPKRLTELDKAQLLEIAKANAAAMCAKAGVPLPPSLKPAVAPVVVEEKVVKKTGGITIQELTEKCKQIAQSKVEDEVVNKPHVSEEEEEDEEGDGPFPNQSLKVNEQKLISFSLNNPSVKPVAKTQVALTKEFPVSSGSQHRKKEVDSAYGEWVPVQKSADQSTGNVFIDTTPAQPVDISSVMIERSSAQKRLEENPFDVEAICLLSRAQEQIDTWAQSNSLPGQFTGSTGAQVLTSEELCNSGPQAWIRKDQFLKAAPVTGGMGAQLMRKMGWREGEGLGKHKEGTVEPIVVDFKTDRKGLVAEGEKTQKKSGNLTVMKDLSGKHPVSALMEICNKKKWSPPEFLLVHDSGPDHRKHFLFKVLLNGIEYQPSLASPNKKHAKAIAATIALQAMGFVPKDSIASATSFLSASDC
ncbi:protein SON isoform X2 [Latimeria chalumnae]|uniref:protein SON isoform X2 n=1 Tax=Latimeria chalumnae TaxID=7897 RepID=UPI0003C13EE9|nr:PREDICTED: protein SON isoform X2 [Latimeria chalumnae]|eukprot:XP_006001529.1 PREDICTED: protein SON isoform X2 [Latimeria chalumnae]